MHKEKEDYLFDFFESLYLYLIFKKFRNFSKNNLFIYEKSDNKGLYNILSELKFNKEVVSNFFDFFEELSNKESYIYFEAVKTDDYRKSNRDMKKKHGTDLGKISDIINLIDSGKKE